MVAWSLAPAEPPADKRTRTSKKNLVENFTRMSLLESLFITIVRRSLLIPVFRIAFENLLWDHPHDKQHLIDSLGNLKVYSDTGQKIGIRAIQAPLFH